MEDTLAQALECAGANLGRIAAELGAEFAAVLFNPGTSGAVAQHEIVHRWFGAGHPAPRESREPSPAAFIHRWTTNPRAVAITLDFPGRPPVLNALPNSVAMSLDAVALTFWSAQEIGKLRVELRVANQRLASRKLVERAKGVLQLEQGLSEESAYAYLRGQSRHRRITLARLAEEVVRGRARIS
jgi:hypothetical protein